MKTHIYTSKPKCGTWDVPGRKWPRTATMGKSVGCWDSNGLPRLRGSLLPQRPGILKNFSHFISSEEEADCGFNRGSCWRHRGKNEKIRPPRHLCRSAVSQTGTDLEPLKDSKKMQPQNVQFELSTSFQEEEFYILGASVQLGESPRLTYADRSNARFTSQKGVWEWQKTGPTFNTHPEPVRASDSCLKTSLGPLWGRIII